VGDEARKQRGLARVVVHPSQAVRDGAQAGPLGAVLSELEGAGSLAVSRASNAAELRAELERGADVLVLDLAGAGHGALDVLRERRARGFAAPVLALADFGDGEAAGRARALGPCRVLPHDGLTPAILRAALGEWLELSPAAGPVPPAPRSAARAPAALWQSDARGALTGFTRRFAERLNLDQSRPVGSEWLEHLHPEDRPRWDQTWRELLDAPRERTLDVRVRGAETSHCWVRFALLPDVAADGTVTRVVGSLFDVDDLIGACEDAQAELARHESATRELLELAYAGAHDLQEPLRSLERELEEAQRGEPADLALALRQVGRMRALLRDLVDYAASTQIRVGREPSELSQALEWALENLRPTIAELGAEIKIETLVRVSADPIQLARVFQNLIANALHFAGDAPPRIVVGARVEELRVTVLVRDFGIGIARAHHESIFRVFERVHGSEHEGSGMGLAICRRIVERHGGRIWVESEPGAGATFYFTLPKAE
jgi:signal transduction histidine kinase